MDFYAYRFIIQVRVNKIITFGNISDYLNSLLLVCTFVKIEAKHLNYIHTFQPEKNHYVQKNIFVSAMP